MALSSINIFNIMDIRFSPDNQLVCVAAEHDLAVFTIESKLKIMRTYIQEKPKSLEGMRFLCLEFLEEHILTGTSAGHLYVWRN